jgi:hypothetical protein
MSDKSRNLGKPSTNISIYLQRATISEIDKHAERLLRARPASRKISRSEACEDLIWLALKTMARGRR